MPDLPYGAFAENLTVSELREDTVCLGDVYAIGDARLQVSQPRQPCSNITRRWDIRGLTQKVEATGRTGWYLRVLTEAFIEAGWTCSCWSDRRRTGRSPARRAPCSAPSIATKRRSWRPCRRCRSPGATALRARSTPYRPSRGASAAHAPPGAVEKEAQDVEQHRQRSLGPRPAWQRTAPDQVQRQLQVPPQDARLGRRIAVQRGRSAVALEHERHRSQRNAREVEGRIAPRRAAPIDHRAVGRHARAHADHDVGRLRIPMQTARRGVVATLGAMRSSHACSQRASLFVNQPSDARRSASSRGSAIRSCSGSAPRRSSADTPRCSRARSTPSSRHTSAAAAGSRSSAPRSRPTTRSYITYGTGSRSQLVSYATSAGVRTPAARAGGTTAASRDRAAKCAGCTRGTRRTCRGPSRKMALKMPRSGRRVARVAPRPCRLPIAAAASAETAGKSGSSTTR